MNIRKSVDWAVGVDIVLEWLRLIGMADPSSIDRFGSLCLGESSHLVDSIDLLPDDYDSGKLQWLERNRFGWFYRIGLTMLGLKELVGSVTS